MSKKIIVLIVLCGLCSIFVFLFIANEYYKIVQQKSIETYIVYIKQEFNDNNLKAQTTPVICKGFIKYDCSIKNAYISNNYINLEFDDIDIVVSNIGYNKAGVSFKIGKINNKTPSNKYSILIPNSFEYYLNIIKEDSKLGYLILNRAVNMGFKKFNLNLNLDILIRDKVFSNKNIISILKQWFDDTTPSFYEYNLDNLNVNISLNSPLNKSNAAKFKSILNELKNVKIFNTSYANAYFLSFINKTYELLDSKFNNISAKIYRKNNDLIFFNQLTNDASMSKILEIMQILNSIDETYKITLYSK